MPISLGSKNDIVFAVQRILISLGYRYLYALPTDDQPMLVCQKLNDDGVFGPQTQAALMDFQRDNALLIDGVVGRTTMAALEAAYARHRLEIDSPGIDALDAFDRDRATSRAAMRLPFARVDIKPHADFPTFTDASEAVQLRSDVARAFQRVADAAQAAGAPIIVGGGRRALDSPASDMRAALSFQHLGRGIELFRYAGMVDPQNDPYVIEMPDAGHKFIEWREKAIAGKATEDELLHPPQPWFWRVWARCRGGVSPPPRQTICSITTYVDYRAVKTKPVEDNFFDLTAALAAEGFHPSPPKPRFFDFDGAMLYADWWYFNYEPGLIPDVTTYGGELLRVYSETSLAGTPPWEYRRAVYGRDWGPKRD